MIFHHRSRFYVLLYHKAGFPTTRNLQDIKKLFSFLIYFTCPGISDLALSPAVHVEFSKKEMQRDILLSPYTAHTYPLSKSINKLDLFHRTVKRIR